MTLNIGYYWTAIKIYTVIIGFFSAFTGVMMPRISSLLSEGNIDKFNQMILKSFDLLFAITIPLLIFTFILSPQIISLLSGKGYEGAVVPMRIIMPLVIVVGIAQILAIQVLMPMSKDKIIFYASIFGAAIGIILNIILVKKYGSTGAAIVLLFSEITVTLYYIFATYKLKILDFSKISITNNFIFSIPYVFICYGIIYIFENRIYQLLFASLVSISYFLLSQIFFLKQVIAVSYWEKFKLKCNKRQIT